MTLEVTTDKAHTGGMVITLDSLFVENTGLIEDDRRRRAALTALLSAWQFVAFATAHLWCCSQLLVVLNAQNAGT